MNKEINVFGSIVISAIILFTFSTFVHAGWNDLVVSINNGTLTERYRDACRDELCFIEQITALIKLDTQEKYNKIDSSVYHKCADQYIFANGMPDLDKVITSGCTK